MKTEQNCSIRCLRVVATIAAATALFAIYSFAREQIVPFRADYERAT